MLDAITVESENTNGLTCFFNDQKQAKLLDSTNEALSTFHRDISSASVSMTEKRLWRTSEEPYSGE